MPIPIIYLSHPYGGNWRNAELAGDWCGALNILYSGRAMFVAPWVDIARTYASLGNDAVLYGICVHHVDSCDAMLAITYDADELSPGQTVEMRATGIGVQLYVPGYARFAATETADDRRRLLLSCADLLAPCIESLLEILDLDEPKDDYEGEPSQPN